MGLVGRICHQSSGVFALRHVLAKMRTVLEHEFVVIGIAIRSLGNVLEPVVVQLTKKAGVPLVVEVLGADLRLEHDRHVNLKGTAMGHPRDPFLVLLCGKDIVNFLREGHIFDLFGVLIPLLWRDFGEVSVRVVHNATGGLHGLNHHRHGRKLGLFDLGSFLARDRLGENDPLSDVHRVGFLTRDVHDDDDKSDRICAKEQKREFCRDVNLWQAEEEFGRLGKKEARGKSAESRFS
eukprot:scaffold39232_cov145-Amphora_coffeaeformis.AAC.1